MSTTTPVNQQTLEQLKLLELERPGLMKELIRLFVADAPRQMRLIDVAYAARDPYGLQQASHFLRSGALALGLSWLAERSRGLELMVLGQYGSLDSNRQVAELRGELHKVLLALLQQLKSG